MMCIPLWRVISHLTCKVKIVFSLLGSSGAMIDFIKACLKDVRFNHNPVQLFSNSSGISVTNSFVSPGCKGDAVCSSNPCPSTATCEDVWNAYACKCPLGTVAPLCNASSNCTNNLCTNDASCATLDNGGYTCVCGSNFTGVYCEETIQPCSANPCIEGHYTSCQNISPTNYLCVCSSGWTGNQCQINIDECASAPCLNNGVCIDLVNGYNCSCDTRCTLDRGASRRCIANRNHVVMEALVRSRRRDTCVRVLRRKQGASARFRDLASRLHARTAVPARILKISRPSTAPAFHLTTAWSAPTLTAIWTRVTPTRASTVLHVA